MTYTMGLIMVLSETQGKAGQRFRAQFSSSLSLNFFSFAYCTGYEGRLISG